eukprot:3053217-Ditylum_brightwellii.AAC.1
MHWLMRILNSLNGQMEISDTQPTAEIQKERCDRKPSQDDDTTSTDSSNDEIYVHGLLPSTNSGVTLYSKKGNKPKDREKIPVQDQ